MPHPRRIGWLLLLAMGAGGCGETPPRDDAQAAVPPGEAVHRDSGTFADGDEQVAWRRAPGTTADLVFEETARFGSDGVAERRYVFSRTFHLIRFTERRTQTVHFGDRSARPQQVDTDVEFNDQGVVRQARMVDGEVTELAPFDLEAAQRRALALLAAWRPGRQPPR